MEENMHHFWHIRLYYFMEGKNATGTQRFVQCGEGALTDQMCQKKFAEFLDTIDILAK